MKRERNTKSQFFSLTEEMNAIVAGAESATLTEEELLEIQRAILTAHQKLADELSNRGTPYPGNDPHRPI